MPGLKKSPKQNKPKSLKLNKNVQFTQSDCAFTGISAGSSGRIESKEWNEEKSIREQAVSNRTQETREKKCRVFCLNAR